MNSAHDHVHIQPEGRPTLLYLAEGEILELVCCGCHYVFNLTDEKCVVNGVPRFTERLERKNGVRRVIYQTVSPELGVLRITGTTI